MILAAGELSDLEQDAQPEPETLLVTIPYKPRPLQRKLHLDPSRFKVLVCHRRFGKTVWAINDGIKKIIECPLEDPRVMYCAPFLTQAKRIAWDYLIKYSSVIPGIKINRSGLYIDYPNGGRFTLIGADNVDAHRGIYLDHLIMDEYAQMSPRIWGEVFRPALSDREGSAVFIGTPKGRANSFHEVYERAEILPDWNRYLLTVVDSGLIPEKELQSARDEMSEDEYQQEFMCSFDAAIKGAYWGKAMQLAQEQGRIGNVPHEVTLPVYTVCDLGMRDSFAIWFLQFVGKETHVIDYKEYAGMGLPQVFRELKTLPYNYGGHVAPHDIRVKELGTGQSRYEVAISLGVQYQICRNISVQDGIDAVRNFLGKCWFDKTRCQYGIEALRSYHSKFDEIKRIESSAPDHDWSSHGADAMRYAAVTFGGGQTGFDFSKLDYSRMDRRSI